jgi:hypothetical protein
LAVRLVIIILVVLALVDDVCWRFWCGSMVLLLSRLDVKDLLWRVCGQSSVVVFFDDFDTILDVFNSRLKRKNVFDCIRSDLITFFFVC